MKTFIRVCQYCRGEYPKIWLHHAKRDMRAMVVYWLPGEQLKLWNV